MGLWLLAACGSALFAGMTSILAKIGLSDTDSTVATAIRTGVVLLMAWLASAVAGSIGQVTTLAPATWAFLGLSGLSTGASWLCYFRALKLGDVSRVVPVDKASVVLTVLLACLLLGEPASLVVPIDKLSVLVSVVLAFVLLRERPTTRNVSGLAIVTAGTLVMLL